MTRVDELHESGGMSSECAWVLRRALMDEGCARLACAIEALKRPEMVSEPRG